MSEYVPDNEWHVREWLDSLGVLCDCFDGYRKHEHSYLRPEDRVQVTDTVIEPCDRCVLVEVGGIRVRVRRSAPNDWTLVWANRDLMGLMLPAVEVTDE